MYHYVDKHDQQRGPIVASEFPKYGITRNTLVRREGMSDWQTASSVPELSGIFQSRIEEKMAKPAVCGAGNAKQTLVGKPIKQSSAGKYVIIAAG